jgi:uncharacterized protein YecT (DUF1311 family)
LIAVLAQAQTQAELTGQACKELKEADEELNRVYRQIAEASAADVAFAKALRDAQRAWIAFRRAQVKSIFPDPDPAAYGSANPMCRCAVLQQLTLARTEQLRKRWIEGSAEGDLCAGSSRVKR